MAAPSRPAGLTILAVLLALTSVGTVLFWIDWFFGGHVATAGEACYVAFENAFPLADGVMVLFMLLAALGLWRVAPAGYLFGLLGAGGLLCLGALDTSYNLQHGKYATIADPAMVFEAYINVHSFLMGVLTIVLVHRHRARLLAGSVAGEAREGTTALLHASALVFVLLFGRVAAVWAGARPWTFATPASASCAAIFAATFPPAEALAALAGLVAVAGFFLFRPFGLTSGLTASGALAFRASMKTLFLLENAGPKFPATPARIGWAAFLYAFAIVSALAAWRARGRLLAGGPAPGGPAPEGPAPVGPARGAGRL
jgi:hypothetical protein